ncbi:McrC family protein [Emticicia sp. BO119]|uniref:McrC family protein n=1 Tax=Emticicia sp. BO119 TaxID=2757768 RepID=UPI0015F10913|nr:McrC family protein [Emticicia sp. BO119]MBA4851243.1 McrC family protein [Emticicia sp. BO119]
MIKTLVISEFGAIKKASDYDSPIDSFAEIFVSDNIFHRIKELVFSYASDTLLTYSAQRGREQIKVKNYVGLIPVSDTIQLEILPKSTADSPKEARRILLKLLQKIPSYQALTKAHLAVSNLPLLEIYVKVFLDELDKLLSMGLGRNYEPIEANETFIKGKILITENIHQNLLKQHRVFIGFDDFIHDIPQNRILKTCLHRLKNYSFTNLTRQRVWQSLSVFDEISLSANLHQDFTKSSTTSPHSERYENLLQWAWVFLNEQSFLPFSGNYAQISLLFPMEMLFENYVGKLFQKYANSDNQIRLQDRRKHLVLKHRENAKFRMIPDIVAENSAGELAIFDTKWKLIDASKPKQNYGIEQADLYQMYAYGKKYQAQKLYLIYPANENFRQPLEVFDYDEDLMLHVLPFDLMNEGEAEVRKIMQ